MSMQETNYCRQMLSQYKAMAAVPNPEPEKRASVYHTIDLCRASQKFILPLNGELLPDADLRALDESEPLRLPHPFVALEFPAQLRASSGELTPAKKVIFCREDDEGIYVRPAAHVTANGFWMVQRDTFIPKTNYLDRSDPAVLKVVADYQGTEGAKNGATHVRVVLGFLNALACSNVRIESRPPRKAGKKIKSALPFDTYHVLTVDVGRKAGTQQAGEIGSGRSPREHLRRGHIRRLADGRRVWVNATVVAAEKSAGKIKKDYRVVNSGATT